MVGQHIGKYRVTQQVGRGGMGTVYSAVDETLHRDVAIKVLNAGLDDPTVGRRFRAEAITVARLNHPGIATIYELVQHDGQWLMVMEFVRGETLEQALAQQGPMPVARAAEAAMQLLAALAHAHGLGVVHRDLKPANIMLTAGGSLKIMDFGIARVAGAEQLTSAGFMMGTPAYMAPEQVLGGEIDARADLYAAGIVLFQMVTGSMPFAGTTPVQVAQARISEEPTPLATLRPDLPAWLAQVITIALSRDPDRRFQSAMLFREAVRRGLAGLPIQAPDPAAAAASVTAAPGELRVVKGDRVPAVPKPVVPPAAALPTMAGPVPVPSGADPVEVVESPARAVSPVVIAAVAAVLLLVGAGAWFLMPGPSEPAPAPAAAAPSGAPVAADSAVTLAPDAAASVEPRAAMGVATARTSTAPPLPSATPASTPAAPRGATPGPAPGVASPAASASPPATPAAPVPALFRGIRALVLTGRRAQERPAVLAFADGSVTLFDEGGRTPLVTMPYRQVTSAAYTRDRDPRWYPTLAGPPIDVDMPGGLFRGDRHWLALQSRDAWMIVRMNDGDWRAITEAVTTFLGLGVEELRP